MEALRTKAEELLDRGEVQVVIGYEAGTAGTHRPCFARTTETAARLVWDTQCIGNLAGYLTRPEIKRFGKPAIAANSMVLRSLLQLVAERQLQEDSVLALAVTQDGAVTELPTVQAVEEYLATSSGGLSAADREKLDQIMISSTPRS